MTSGDTPPIIIPGVFTVIPSQQNSTITEPQFRLRPSNSLLPYKDVEITSKNAHQVAQLAYIKTYSPTIGWVPRDRLLVINNSGWIDFLKIGTRTMEVQRSIKYPFKPPDWTVDTKGLSFSSNSKYFATGNFENYAVVLYNVADGSIAGMLNGHSHVVTTTAFSPRSDLLASGSSDKTILLWHLPDLTLIRTLEGHANSVNSIAFSPDGDLLVSSSDDGTVRLWSVKDGTQLNSWGGISDSDPFFNGNAASVTFSPNGDYITAGGYGSKGEIRVWRVLDGSEVYYSEFDHFVSNVAFSPNSEILAVHANYVYLLRASTGELLASLQPSPLIDYHEIYWTSSVAFSPDGHLLASLENQDNNVYIWGLPKSKK
jgi:WD40 repeat protein